MRRIRFAKVRITGPRPPGVGAVSPLERHGATRGGSVGKTGLEYLAESQKREAAEHDRNVRDYTVEMLPAVYDDVCRRIAGFTSMRLSKTEASELRWWRSRKAALLRLGSSMRERGLA